VKTILQLDRQRIIDIFLQAACINSLSGSEKPIADFIKSFLTACNYKVSEDNSQKHTSSNSGNLVCEIGTGGDFLLVSHMDTARPTLETKPIIMEDKIVSAGDTVLGVDNRAGIAVLLYILEKITKENIPVIDFTVAFTTCEESTLFGSKNLCIKDTIKKCFVFDSGYRPGNFIFSSCGAIGFNLKIIGKASHSGISPENGINSLYAAAEAISKLPLGRIDEETTMNIGKLTSGSAVNVIPELTELEGEVRSFDLKKAENYFNLVVDTFKKEANAIKAKIECNHFWDFKPYKLKENSDVYKETVRAIKKVGLIPIPNISLGGSDANSLNERGIESVNLGIGAQNPHSNEEFIYIEDLVASSAIALEIVKRIN
jgi:tripeptide aminopeptidase